MPRSRSTAIAKFGLLITSIIIAASWSFSTIRPKYTVDPSLEAWMLDVGQGESVLVHEPSGKKLLFDGGPSDVVLSELGDILPAWDKTIDVVVVSHNHSDHIRGIIDVLKRYDVKELWISGSIHTTADYLAFLEQVKIHTVHTKVSFFDIKACTTVCPVPIAFGDATLQVYHPLSDSTGIRPADQHDTTVAVKVSYKSASILLTGDLDEQHEQSILSACKAPACSLQATVMQVPHHGSATGLSPGFIQAVSPQAALIPVGIDNKYGHPDPTILTKLSNVKIPIYRTDTQGRIHVIVRPTSLNITTSR